ncbi:MAG: hypothetical protein JW891_01670 [Candidatus Lokiarchaeota archaeon]|nr:hypothetical protein [Candidatus Lokiarchaeota archaeon]
MPKKYVVFFKSIGRQWVLILILVIIIIAFYNATVAIWLTIITIIIYIITFVPPLVYKSRLMKFVQMQERIEDKQIARYLNKPMQKVQERMFKLSEKQDNKPWLVVFLNKQYIFYRDDIVEKFNQLLEKGLSEKELLENMQGSKISTRAEVKAMKDTLIRLSRARQPEKQKIEEKK